MYNSKIAFGKEIVTDLPTSESQEWLVTNGLGGFASGTVSGILTRRYHGILIAALNPPVERTLLATKLDEFVTYSNKQYALSANRWASQVIDPQGYLYIENFSLEGSIPVWTYSFGDALLQKRIWMEQGANTTYIQYYLKRGLNPVDISLKAMINYRDFNGSTFGGKWKMNLLPINNGFEVVAFDKAVPYYLTVDNGKVKIDNVWYHNYFLKKENARGLDCVEDHLLAGTFQIQLQEDQTVTFVVSTENNASTDGNEALKRRRAYENELMQFTITPDVEDPWWVNQLKLAADQFIVERSSSSEKTGYSIIAGYHWFSDWGRDTMISLPGLTLATGRSAIAKKILKMFSGYVSEGMLPNRFPNTGEPPQYNTADATLWFFHAIHCYYEATLDINFVNDVFPILAEIIHWHLKGTRYGIHVDPKDGLLYAGKPGVQLTWMDAKIGDWVVTPRTGKAVEINALWYQALITISMFSDILKVKNVYQELAIKAHEGFQKFWNAQKGYCYDVIDSPQGNLYALRPNQLLAVSLCQNLLSIEQQKQVVDACTKHLLTGRGLRSLSEEDPAYHGHYEGNQIQRDSVYHQGAVWGWLLGPYCQAHLKVYQDKKYVVEILENMSYHLFSAGLGTCSEIFDGDEPGTPRGCIAQAWTVAEILRIWKLLVQNTSAL